MKIAKFILSAFVAGTLAFAARNASAFPLTLKSLNGSITVTPSSSVLSSNKAVTVTKGYNLQTILTLVSNTLAYAGNPPPKGSFITIDPVNRAVYMTNNNGYVHSLYSITNNYYMRFYLEDMAGSFTTNNAGINENDKIIFELYFNLLGLDGNAVYATGGDYGEGTLKVTVNSSKASMDMKGSGPDYGEFGGSSDGVSSGSFEAQGSAAAPDWSSAPFVTWWE